MNHKTLFAILCLAIVPTAYAHVVPGAPDPACGDSNPHDYVGWSSTSAAGRSLGFVTVTDGCADVATDGDYEFGWGGAFLPADHHTGNVCVDDNVVAQVSFSVGADVDGDGAIAAAFGDDLASGTGCVNAGFGAGADGGWWVFIHQGATSGHVTTS